MNAYLSIIGFRISLLFLVVVLVPYTLKTQDSKTIVIEANKIEPNISLVLSGGGARGFAQIGVLRALDSLGLKYQKVVGTSMGAIIGSLLCVGYSISEIDSILRKTSWEEIMALNTSSERENLFLDKKVIRDKSLLTLRFDESGLDIPEAISVGTKLHFFLQDLLFNGNYFHNNFDSLRYKFRAVASNLTSGESVSIDRGDLVKAVRASATVPLRYSPVRYEGMVLVDGGLLGNIPVRQAKEDNPDLIVAINTTSPLLSSEELNTPWNIADQVVSLMIQKYSSKDIEMADILITPEIDTYSNVDFADKEDIINIGYRNAIKYAAIIIKKVDSIRFNNFCISIYELNKNIDINSKFNFTNTENNEKHQMSFIEFYEKTFANPTIDNIEISFDGNSFVYKSKNYIKLQKAIVEFDNIENFESVSIEIENQINSQFKSLPLSKSNLLLIKNTILKVAKNNNFNFLYIASNQIDKDGTLSIAVAQRKIKNILVNSRKKSDRFIVLREILFAENQVPNVELIKQSWKNLYSTELFSDVSIELFVNADNSLDVDVKVIEHSRNLINFAARVDNERRGQVSADLIKENFLDKGIRIGLNFAGGARNQLLSLTTENARIGNSLIGYRLSGYYNNRNFYIYQNIEGTARDRYARRVASESTEERFGFRGAITTQLERWGRVSAGIRWERQRFYDLSINELPSYNELALLRLSSTFDSRNRADFPTIGFEADFLLETSAFSVLPDAAYTKMSAYYTGAFTIFKNNTFIPKVFFGAGDATMPLPEFFSLGGQNVFWGMREDEERGRQIFISSLEYRLKLPVKIVFESYLSLRYDLGGIWLNPENIKLGELRHGAGVNLGFDTPIGPVNLGLGRSFYFLKNPATVTLGDVKGYFEVGIPF